jgi:hypothetical protein
MIDRLLELLRYAMYPYLNILAAIVFVIKASVVVRNRGLNLPAVFLSVFRIYSKSEMNMTNNEARQKYMKINNLFNYYLYAWALLLIITILVFQSPY